MSSWFLQNRLCVVRSSTWSLSMHGSYLHYRTTKASDRRSLFVGLRLMRRAP